MASCPSRESQGWGAAAPAHLASPWKKQNMIAQPQLPIEFKENVSQLHILLHICFLESATHNYLPQPPLPPPHIPDHHSWKTAPQKSEFPSECAPGLFELVSSHSLPTSFLFHTLELVSASGPVIQAVQILGPAWGQCAHTILSRLMALSSKDPVPTVLLK